MKQILFNSEKTLEIKETSTPIPNNQQALLKTLVTGISAGTEGMWWDASATALKTGRKQYPYYPGYELVGEVIALGNDFSGLNIGDRVFAMKPHASHALLNPSDIFFKLPDSVSNEQALAIALTGTSLHAIHRSAITIGDHCVVVGLGILGFNLLQVLKNAMSCRVLSVTGSEKKQNLSIKLGSDMALNKEDAFDQRCNMKNIDATFDCSGINDGLDTCIKLVGDQGKVIAAGFYTDTMEIDGENIFSKELTIVGVRATGVAEESNAFNRWTRNETMKLAFELVSKGLVDNQNLITHRVHIDNVENIENVYNIICNKSESYLQAIILWN